MDLSARLNLHDEVRCHVLLARLHKSGWDEIGEVGRVVSGRRSVLGCG